MSPSSRVSDCGAAPGHCLVRKADAEEDNAQISLALTASSHGFGARIPDQTGPEGLHTSPVSRKAPERQGCADSRPSRARSGTGWLDPQRRQKRPGIQPKPAKLASLDPR